MGIRYRRGQGLRLTLPSVATIAMEPMKAAIAIVILLAPSVFAEAAPRGSFSGSEFEAAKAKAKETGKPIAVVVTNTESSCPKCQAGNVEVFKQMRSDYVLVVNDEAKKDKLPANIEQRTYEIYKSKGNVIPIVAVLSPADDKVLGGLCYKQISADSRKAFKNLEDEVEAAMANATPAAATPAAKPAGATPEKPAATAEACETGGMREWKNIDGKTIKAEALGATELVVTFKLENGKVLDYPLNKLSEESRTAVEKICGDE